MGAPRPPRCTKLPDMRVKLLPPGNAHRLSETNVFLFSEEQIAIVQTQGVGRNSRLLPVEEISLQGKRLGGIGASHFPAHPHTPLGPKAGHTCVLLLGNLPFCFLSSLPLQSTEWEGLAG